MKKSLLFSFLFITMCTLNAQITYTSFGDGWPIPMNADLAVDIDDDGTSDFYINKQVNELGFTPIFAKGCFASPNETAYTSFNSRELLRHEQDELIQLNGANLYDYIDDDRGSGYSLTGGLADGWESDAKVFIGFAILNGPSVRNGWLTASVNIATNELTIWEWAYTDWENMDTGGILAGDRGETSSVKTLNTIADISISPNPADARVQINFDYSGSEDLSVIIQNSVGQVVYKTGSALPTGKINLNLETTEWTNGIYFVRFETETGIRTEKLTISR